MILNTKEISYARYKFFCQNVEHSLLRIMQYESIDGIHVPGKVLDIGGTHDPKLLQKQLLKGYTEYIVLNLPQNKTGYLPDIEADCNVMLPLDDNSFDNVVSFNCVEHLYNITFAVEEMYRVVKPTGKILLHIPFLYPIHGAPDDFHRPTASWWQNKFKHLGVSDDKIKCLPLVWDILSSGISLMDNRWGKTKRKFFRPLYLLPALLRKKILNKEISQQDKDNPLGYFIEVVK